MMRRIVYSGVRKAGVISKNIDGLEKLAAFQSDFEDRLHVGECGMMRMDVDLRDATVCIAA
jgi:hypothetical protein